MTEPRRLDDATVAVIRGAAMRVDEELTRGVSDESRPPRVPFRWSLRLLRAPRMWFGWALVAYAAAFLGVAGSSGVRVSLWAWLRADTTSFGEILTHLLTALLVGAVSAVVAVVAGNVAFDRARGRGSSGSGGQWSAVRLGSTGTWASWRTWPWLVGLALAVGCAAQARLVNDSGAALLPAITALLGIGLGVAASPSLATMGHRPNRTMWVGIGLGVVALVMRLVLPVVLGNPNSGSVGPFAVGEVARALAAVGAALALAGVQQQVRRAAVQATAFRTMALGLLGRLLPSLLMVFTLALFDDLGPALILLATMAAMTLLAYSRAYWWRFTGIILVIGAGLAGLGSMVRVVTRGRVDLLGHAEQVATDRFDADCSTGAATQACTSLRALNESGLWPPLREWGSGLPSGSTLVRHLAAAESDYAITTMSGWVGMALVVALLIAILAVALRIFLAATSLPVVFESGQTRLRVGAAAGLQLLLPTAMLGVAVLLPRIPGTTVKWPLTGLDVPFIAANGVSTLAYSAMLALGALLTAGVPGSGDPGPAAPMPNRRAAAAIATKTVPLVSALLVVGAVWIHLGWSGAGSVRLNGESLMRDNFASLLMRDGTEFSVANNAAVDPSRSLGARLYPEPDLAVDLGFFLPGRTAHQAVGLEWLAAPLLTCGSQGSPQARLTARCSAADTVATVDARIQRAAAARADDATRAVPAARADVVLVDRRTGGVVALASSDADDPAMQQVITQATSTEGWQPPTLLDKRDVAARVQVPVDPAADPEGWSQDRTAFAMRQLQVRSTTCVTPRPAEEDGEPAAPTIANPRRPGEAWTARWPEDLGPSRQQCQQDKQGLDLMRPWYEASQPGSTFKVATALAAASTGVAMPPDDLAVPLREVDGIRLPGSIGERSTLDRCGKQTLDWMLLQSCNTTAAWLGIRAGWPALADAAAALGFYDGGSTILGPADPTDPLGRNGSVHYPTSAIGADPSTRTEVQADGVERPFTEGSVALATGNAAIGQDQVRATVLDMAAITHAIVGSGNLSSTDGSLTTDDQVSTEYAPPTAMNMIAGACTAEGFEPSEYPARDVGASQEQLAQVRRGMWWAVNHPTSATAKALRPVANGGPRAIEPLDVLWAKTGSAELGPADDSTGGVRWARWVMGATDQYVFVARVKDFPQGGGDNPAVGLIKGLLDDLRGVPEPPDLGELCR